MWVDLTGFLPVRESSSLFRFSSLTEFLKTDKVFEYPWICTKKVVESAVIWLCDILYVNMGLSMLVLDSHM